ncbi:hypothetical protein C1645_824134 [Glomus cerebriforme]|uniref:Uncharacterized protein n=1 Tax=Glomus cerebriforme TaxID=658196 RepID=A0A397T4B1_9GLOM|nr:hypothetical protein C1645_824134 [Glomus cerebriforme]
MYQTYTDRLISPRPRKYLNILLKPLITSLTCPIYKKQIMCDNTIILHQFEDTPVKDTNNILQDTNCSLRYANTGYLKILSSLQVNMDTIQNTIVEAKLFEITTGLEDLSLVKVSHEEDDDNNDDDDSLQERVDKQNEDTNFEDAVAELKEIISNSQYLSSHVFPIRIDDINDRKATSPILRAQNPIPFNKPFMNNNYKNDTSSFSVKI